MNWTCQCDRCVRSREVFRILLVGAVLTALVLLVTGCGISATKAHIDMALAMCEPNSGLDRMTTELMQSGRQQITAYCNNGVVATKIMEAK